jgi:hypothetical protein
MKLPSELYYTPRETQQILQISQPALRSLVRRKELRRVIPPGRKQGVFLRAEVDAYAREWSAFLAGAEPETLSLSEFPFADAVITFADDESRERKLVSVTIRSRRISDEQLRTSMRSVIAAIRRGKVTIAIVFLAQDQGPVLVELMQRAGSYRSPIDEREYARLQCISLSDLLLGIAAPRLPPTHGLRSLDWPPSPA